MTPAEQAIADDLLRGQLDLLRFEVHARTRILTLLTKMQVELTTKLQAEDLTAFNKARTQQMLRQATDVIDKYYAAIESESTTLLTGAGGTTAQHTARTLGSTLNVVLGGGLPSETFLARMVSTTLIMGAPSAEWWARQSKDTSFRFANAVRQGLTAGETNEQIVRRVAGSARLGTTGIMDVARNNARSLIHTSIQAIANEARRETFRKNSDVITGLRQLSTLDSHTTEICVAYSGQEWDLETEVPINGSTLPFNGGCPRHWACRSIEVPITKTFKQLGIDIAEPTAGDRASTAGPVAARTSFAQFLKRQGEDYQNEVLGVGKAALWRDGKITLQQLLNMQGNPLTLAQLTKKYG